MKIQKYQNGEAVMLLEIGTKLPLHEVEIIGFVGCNPKPYRVRYIKPQSQEFSIDDVEEEQLISFMDIGRQNAYKPEGL